ncbi:hypothetical protein IHV09_14280 [Fictibacillus sp. 23RED33]|uniref:hypothetical protein n=1 Tax=Fictibacillus sp. 23RED33 TaxID=2745879 RepID=UPI0018CCC6D9|nr:hypothetical protein [Fictibacillus sp. 23RED33]MBH0174732.1 hypothetical protein [Fictibacillus sp. 23RED33]
MKVGEDHIFKHRKSPFHDIITEKGTVLEIGRTKDGVKYALTTVGSFTKKFVIA